MSEIIKNKKKKRMYLGIIPVGFFLLGIINIQFGILGSVCFGIAFGMLLKTKSKIFCNEYCFRVRDFEIINKYSFLGGKVAPKSIKNWKKIMLYYFGVSMTILTISTIMVAIGRKEPVEMVKFLMIIPIPLPQLIKETTLFGPVLLHLSYRFYSMVLTTFTLGAILATIYKPRTWCAVCPYNSVATEYIKLTK